MQPRSGKTSVSISAIRITLLHVNTRRATQHRVRNPVGLVGTYLHIAGNYGGQGSDRRHIVLRRGGSGERQSHDSYSVQCVHKKRIFYVLLGCCSGSKTPPNLPLRWDRSMSEKLSVAPHLNHDP